MVASTKTSEPTRDAATGTGPLAERMARVMRRISHVEKGAQAPQAMGGFKYVKETDVYHAARPLLAEEGIAITARATDWSVEAAGQTRSGNTTWMTKGLVIVTFHANGEALENAVPMYALDSGDKGGQKLMSNAVKYAVLKALLISTGEDDAEREEIQVTRFQPASPAPTRNGTNGVRPETTGQIRGLVKQLKDLGVDLKVEPPHSQSEAEAIVKSLEARIKRESEKPANGQKRQGSATWGPAKGPRSIQETAKEGSS